jgi:hypothetical protein
VTVFLPRIDAANWRLNNHRTICCRTPANTVVQA